MAARLITVEDLNKDMMEKTIFDVVAHGSILFADPILDTVITANSSGLYWWCIGSDGKFYLADKMETYLDLKRMPVEFAKKLAQDWYDHSVGTWSVGTATSVSEQVEARNPRPRRERQTTTGKTIRLIEPGFVDDDKRDAHTEHCCKEHKTCYYSSDKCTVAFGRKKATYPCTCDRR